MRLVTVGHGTLAAAGFASILVAAGVTSLVDIRSAPGSRRLPHFGRRAMEVWLPDAGITYCWEPRLGGWRHPQPESPNGALRNPSFRGYADHMGSDEFRGALHELLVGAEREPTAVMCSESLWWRCHRRLVADAAVLLEGAEVLHLAHDGSLSPHRPSPEAVVTGGRLRYPPVTSLREEGGPPGANRTV